MISRMLMYCCGILLKFNKMLKEPWLLKARDLKLGIRKDI